MVFGKERMSSYVDRGNKLIAEGKTPEAMKLIERGLQHYSEKSSMPFLHTQRQTRD